MSRRASVSIPLTCGELVQGLWHGIPALVSCPIDTFHRAHLQVNESGTWDIPVGFSKVAAAMKIGCRQLDFRGGGVLRLNAPGPRGRGYGTSTADIGASLYALGEAVGKPFSPSEVTQIAVQVEPSDSTLFPSLALFNHRDGVQHCLWDDPPPLDVLLLDPGGKVDTLAFNQRDMVTALARFAPIHRKAFTLLKFGLANQDWGAFGKAATLSAKTHQEILFSPLLGQALRLAKEIHALGVCRAHSGTLLGLIMNPNKVAIAPAMKFLEQKLPSTVTVSHQHIVGGGPRYLEVKRELG